MSILLALAANAAVSPALSAQTDLQAGLSGALRGCEEWVLNPASWATGPAPFVAKVGLGSRMGLVDLVAEANLPPAPLRRGNHFWRINATHDAGYVLVVSDQLPMCHITGGGAADLQPVAEMVIGSGTFVSRWEKVGDDAQGDMVSTRFRNREVPALELTFSRANAPSGRLDRVQVIATAIYKLGK